MHNIASILKIFLIIVVVLLIASYTYYKTKDFVRGPIVTILYPVDGSTLYDTIVEIKGEAKNISYISIDDRQIFTDESGFFVEKLLLYPGYNIISIKATDKFDRNIEKTLELIYKEPKQDLRERYDLEEQVGEIKTIIDNIDPSTFNQDTRKEEGMKKI